jgi:predicted DCC family thiol-disulfide oxidoreductase YuxK
MAPSSAQAPAGVEDVHLVLYDGVCGLCNHVLQFLLAHDHRAVFTFASLQSGIGTRVVERFGANPDELTTFYVLANYRAKQPQLLSRSRAALFVAGEIGWPWKAAGLFRILPTRVLDFAYDIVARTRYRLFDRFDRCPTPRPEFRRRFIDV